MEQYFSLGFAYKCLTCVAIFAANALPVASQTGFGKDGYWIADTTDASVLLCMDFAEGDHWGQSFAMLYRTDDLDPKYFDILSDPNGFALIERFEDEHSARVIMSDNGSLSFIPTNGAAPLMFTSIDHDTTTDDPNGHGLCGREAFNQPRFDPILYEQNEVPDADVPMTRHVFRDKGGFGSLETIQFAEPDLAIEQVNAFLLGELAEDPKSAPFIDCALMAADSGRYGHWEQQSRLDHVDPSWIVVKNYISYFCGGAYPDEYKTYDVFDRRTGEFQDTSNWLAFNAVDILTVALGADDPMLEIADIPSDLMGAIKQGLPADWEGSSCSSLYGIGTSWSVRPTDGGYIFDSEFPHVGRGCEVDIFLPRQYAEQLLFE